MAWAAKVGARLGPSFSKLKTSGTLRKLAPEKEFVAAWLGSGTVAKICARFGITKADAELVRVMYGLPTRTALSDNDKAPTPEEDAASLESLDLAPMIRAVAEEVKAEHIKMRRNETEQATLCRMQHLDRQRDFPVRKFEDFRR